MLNELKIPFYFNFTANNAKLGLVETRLAIIPGGGKLKRFAIFLKDVLRLK